MLASAGIADRVAGIADRGQGSPWPFDGGGTQLNVSLQGVLEEVESWMR